MEKLAFCILRDRCAFNNERLNATLENNCVEAIEDDYFVRFSMDRNLCQRRRFRNVSKGKIVST